MALKEPTSTAECVYFTRRVINDAPVMAWVYRGLCPKCKKAKMGKPRDSKTGKVKTRAKEYECPSCGNTIEKETYEDSLEVQAKYTCPHCKKKGESTASFERKNVSRFNEEKQKRESVKAFRIPCQHCDKTIDVTKKMK